MSTPRFNSAWFRESISLSLTHDFATLRLVRKISTRPLEFGNAAAFWAAWWTKFQLVFIVIHDIEGEGVEVWDELMALQCAQNAARFELVKCVDENWEPREVMRPGPEEEGWCRVTERAMLEEDEKVMELCEGVRGYRVLLWEGRESHMRRLERARRILDDGVSDGLSMMSVSSVSSRSSESSSC
ncbi:MAG: hypothetical protein MMC23_005047 [Stictis urceolatum]|nr:hypothetical protein [Stictis urceolata]